MLTVTETTPLSNKYQKKIEKKMPLSKKGVKNIFITTIYRQMEIVALHGFLFDSEFIGIKMGTDEFNS
jgi:hypothetical protein